MPRTAKPSVTTIDAVITQDGPHRQAVNVNDIVVDLGVLGPSVSRFDRSAFLTQYRNLMAGRYDLVPVLWRQPNGALALLRFLAL